MYATNLMENEMETDFATKERRAWLRQEKRMDLISQAIAISIVAITIFTMLKMGGM